MGWRKVILWAIVLCAGCRTARDLPQTDFQFFIEQSPRTGGLIWSHRLQLPISKLQMPVCAQPILLASDIAHVSRSESNLGPCLIFHLRQRAMIQFCQLVMEGIGRKIVLCVNGQPLGVSSPLQSENFEGTITIFPEVADTQIDVLIKELNNTLVKLQKLQQ
ncbi:MAG: hypothetical protein LW808_002720 [Verrucomicrobiota bacterium]|nr:MAG: hypothetical protein LW808_002720 [Verrucomicrobiota bacterium]